MALPELVDLERWLKKARSVKYWMGKDLAPASFRAARSLANDIIRVLGEERGKKGN